MRMISSIFFPLHMKHIIIKIDTKINTEQDIFLLKTHHFCLKNKFSISFRLIRTDVPKYISKELKSA